MKCVTSLFFLLAMQSAFAGMVPVVISDPTPSIAANYSVGNSNTFTYTVTNHTPATFPLAVSGISGSVSRTSVTSDCGNTLPGNSSCNIGITIAPTGNDYGASINQTLAVNYQGRMALAKNISFSVSPAGRIFAIGGRNLFAPAIIVSNDGLGQTWTTGFTDNSIGGFILGVGCTGSGSTAVCAGAGEDYTDGSPILVVSADGGNTWTPKSLAGLSDSGILNAASCTGTGSNAICVAGGEDLSGDSLPTIFASTDGGNTWSLKSVPGISTTGVVFATSCTGNGSNAICVAAGQFSSLQPLLAVSTDGGNTWSSQAVSGLSPDDASFYSVSCTGSGSNAICVATGQDETNGSPVLAVSTNGGNTWALKSISDAPFGGIFIGVSCTGNSSTGVCTAIGTVGGGYGFVAASNDGANTWAIKSIPNFPSNAALSQTSCTGSGSSAICIAVGRDTEIVSSSLIVISRDGGNTFSRVPLSGSLATAGNLSAGSCTGAGPTLTTCAVTSGFNVLISTDGGVTWGFAPNVNFQRSPMFQSAASGV